MAPARNHHWIPAAHLGLFGSSVDHVLGDGCDGRRLRNRQVEALDLATGTYIGRVAPDAVLKQRDLYTTTDTELPDAVETAKIPLEDAGRQVLMELDRAPVGPLHLTLSQRVALATYATLLWSQDPGMIESGITMQRGVEWLVLVMSGFSQDDATRHIQREYPRRRDLAVKSTFSSIPDVAAVMFERRVQILRRTTFPWWSINDAGIVSIRSERDLFEGVGVGDEKTMLMLPATPRSLILLTLDDGPEMVRPATGSQAMLLSISIWQTAHRFVFARSRGDLQAMETCVRRELLNIATPRIWRSDNIGPLLHQEHAHIPHRRKWTSLLVKERRSQVRGRQDRATEDLVGPVANAPGIAHRVGMTQNRSPDLTAVAVTALLDSIPGAFEDA